MRLFYSIVVSFISIIGYSQTILYQQESAARTVQDPQAVLMTPGFRATSGISNPFIAKIGGPATENPGGGPTDSQAGTSNPSGTTAPTGQSFHDTKGNIEVNPGGQLQFTLPIALPPGVKSIAPQVNLLYTSGTANGIAGYGWNLSGVTSISRIGKSIDVDGMSKTVDLNYEDYYSFNGQRLILKSGEYGKDGAEYVTEKYSNIKIKSIGSITSQLWKGPEYWEVTFEDGSQAWYGGITTGNSYARTPLDYYIVKWKDSQSNYITYNYAQTNNVVVLSNIMWGGNDDVGTTHFNSIEFNYSPRQKNETSYIKGVFFKQDKRLSQIKVKANGLDFKSYAVTYSTTQNIINSDPNSKVSYEFVDKITESNSTGDEANPVMFSSKPLHTDSYESNFNKYDKIITTGDYNGDGLVDFIAKQPSQGNLPEGYYLYFDAANAGSNFVYLGTDNILHPGYIGTTGSKTEMHTLNILPQNNIVNPKQGIVTITSKYNFAIPYLPITYDIELRYFSIKSDASVLNTINNPLVLEYSKTIGINDYLYDPAIYPNQPQPWFTYIEDHPVSSFITAKTVDVDSDGLSELMLSIADQKCYKRELATYPEDIHRWDCENAGNRFIVIDNDDMRNGTIHTTEPMSKNIFQQIGSGSSSIMDFDNDGFQDIMLLEPIGGSNITVNFFTTDIMLPNSPPVPKSFGTTLSNLSQYELRKVNNEYTVNLKKTFEIKGKPADIQYGDLNGDKNIEILLPIHENTSLTTLTGWSIYLNDGKNLEEHIQGLMPYRPYDVLNPNNNSYFTTKLLDLDNDGKSEIVSSSVAFMANNNNTPYTTWHVNTYNEAQYDPNNAYIKWSFTQKTIFSQVRNNVIVTPVFGDFRINNSTSSILFLINGVGSNSNERKIIGYKHYNLNSDKNITSISQAAQTFDVDYKEFDPDINNYFYAPIKKEQYPYIEIDRISNAFGVSQIRHVAGSVVKKQDYRYRGYIANLHGKGVMGFRQIARTSWYADGFENTKIWSGTEIDPLNDGYPIKEWKIRTNDETKVFPSNLSENNSQLLNFKLTNYQVDKLIDGQVITIINPIDKPRVVTAVLPKLSKIKDFITGTIIQSTINYGDFYLPQETITNTNNGYAIATTNYEYFHNPAGIGSNYYIGREKSRNDISQAYNDIKSVKEEYTYENNLPKTVKTWNRDNTAYLLENHHYDGFGNITQKIISNSVDSQTQTIGSIYDLKGRFVVKKTNNLGLETNITYNDWGQILSQIDPLGNVLTNTYDQWGKVLTSKTNLAGTTTYHYEKDFLSNVIVTQHDPDGDISKKYTNILGQEYMISTKAFKQGDFVLKAIQYDVLGRKIKESEPFFEGQGANQWNIIEYDDSVFPAKVTATAFTGKKMETFVSGLTTTVSELNGYARASSKTTDALGHIVSSTDKGGVIQFAYNAAGEQIRAQYAENIVTTKYDGWGRKSEFNDPSNGLYQYEYDGFGQPKKIVSPKGTKQYTYNNLGQLITQKELSTTDGGQGTNKLISYTYDSKGRVISKGGTSKGKTYSFNISYDTQGRMLSSSENSNGKYFIQKGITYDDKARVISYERQLYSSGILTKMQVENVYNAWNGEMYQVKDKISGKILWELQGINAKGQVLKAKLGTTEINNIYDSNGFLTNLNHSSVVKPSILQIFYSFDAIKNELKSRTTGGDFNIVETFDYDDNNRLVNWTNPVTGIKPATNRNIYDIKGRILENDQIGTMKYENTAKIYQPTGMTLNAAGEQVYTNDLIQSIVYNENNDPVFIDGMKGDVAFQYGLTGMRQRVSYGGNFSSDGDGKFTKFYSEDGSFEVVKDNITGKEKHILYIGGSPYESNIVFLKNFEEDSGSYKFLHKDYIGSILAISDEAGNKLEQRHFDAWGNFTHLQIGNGAIITDKNSIASSSLWVERGYTSHEHFGEVGIIHMNGRLYDPLLRRFLNADEYIQDPYNTQNYNKYGYVLNNPLMFSDPSGEEVFVFAFVAAWGVSIFWGGVITAAIIGSAVGLVAYSLSAAISGSKWQLGGALKSMFWGGVSGAVSFGIGTVFSPAAATGVTLTDKVAGAIGQGLVHGFSQGVLSMVQGANFAHGFASGSAGSWGASLFGGLAGSFANSATGKITTGVILGGVASELTGGNFWQGALIGGVVAGLNHLMHQIDDPFKKQLKNEFVETNRKPGDNATYEDHKWLTEKLPTLKNLKIKTYSEFYQDDNLGEKVPAKQYQESNKIAINNKLISKGSLLNYAYTIGHEMLHVFDAIYNYKIIMNILGKTTNGSHGYKYYKEYRSYNWELNNGNNINVSYYLRQYIFNFNKGGVDLVNKNLRLLNNSVINP